MSAVVIDLKTREPFRIEQHKPVEATVIPISFPDDEHACTRQSRIFQAWLLDSIEHVNIDWVIERLKQGLTWAEMRKLFNGK